jgi:hypothetical protein
LQGKIFHRCAPDIRDFLEPETSICTLEPRDYGGSGIVLWSEWFYESEREVGSLSVGYFRVDDFYLLNLSASVSQE